MNADFAKAGMVSVTDVYTDLHGMQALRSEKNSEAALKKVAQQFESMFISMLLKNMRAANQVFSEGNLFDSQESQFYRDMHDSQLALTLAHGRGFGIAEAMYRQLSRSYGRNTAEPTREIQQQVSLPPMLNAGAIAEEVKLPVQVVAKPTVEEKSELASTPTEFVNNLRRAAKTAARLLGVEEGILIAQAALETGWGRHIIAKEDGKSSFNLFNIKADRRWQGESVEKNTLEYLGGKLTNMAANFRAYDSIEESFKDFTQFIRTSDRYKNAVKDGDPALGFIKNIHQAGYATDPDYVEKIASVYQRVKSILISNGAEADR